MFRPLVAAFVSLALAVPAVAAGEPKLADYFPPPESQGGWRTLLPKDGEPDAAAKDAIAKTAGVNWDKLKAAWEWNTQADGDTGLLVIRRGHIVGEWYKGGDKSKPFLIYSSSKSYTSLAYGLLLDDSAAGKLPGGRSLTLDTKVCNAEWLPESLPLSDPRKADITVRHLLNMASGVADGNLPTEKAPFAIALGRAEGSPFATLKSDPGTKFYYSNAGVTHLVLLFKRAAGEDLHPFVKRRVLTPIGVENLTWDQIGDKEGPLTSVGQLSQGYSGIHTPPREHARFCYLALHRGQWAGKQVVPASYYEFAWKGIAPNPSYGAQWWTAARLKSAGAPADLVQTAGKDNNHGYVIPSLDLVFVRLGNGTKFPKDYEKELVSRVLAAVEK
jgi:CubicO group peptidase (beta-lactamase class C family)